VLREIRNIDQKRAGHTKRWFQDDYFDLIVWVDQERYIEEFQLCYGRETWGERVFEWRRGRGFQHLKRDEHPGGSLVGEGDTWGLSLDGTMPYVSLKERFAASAANLPEILREFIDAKLDEYARPRRFRPAGATTPRWLERLRENQRRDARLALLEGNAGRTKPEPGP
jgi:hypothetical protein